MSEAVYPPLRLFLGTDAYQLAGQHNMQYDMRQWQSQATATDFSD